MGPLSNFYPQVSVSTSQKCSYLYLHRAYMTPVQLYKWGSGNTPLCPKCERDYGDLIHMILRCPKLFRYWSRVISTISQVFQLHIVNSPVVCFLGALEEETLNPHGHTAVLRLLYMALKLIAWCWMSPRVHSWRQWVD